MSENCRVRRKSNAPQRTAAQNRHPALKKVTENKLVVREKSVKRNSQIPLAECNADGPDNLDDSRQQRCGRGSAHSHGGQPEQPEDENRVEENVEDNSGRADHRSHGHMIRDLEQSEVCLGNPSEKIGPAGDAQVRRSDPDQLRLVRVDHHQIFRDEKASGPEQK